MASAAEWGWLAAATFSSPPRPAVEWAESGEPTIVLGERPRRAPVSVVHDEEAAGDLASSTAAGSTAR